VKKEKALRALLRRLFNYMAAFWEIDLHRKLSVPGEKVARAGVY